MSAYDPDAPARAVADIAARYHDWDELATEYQDMCRRMAQAAIDTLTAGPPPPGITEVEDF